jgi:pyruvate dehydrogenase E2 component (dihydrolipoamide acetyltransferase)
MPALSPTMASGSLAEWYVSEGAKFSAGDALAKIETDKASIDFEAQDDGYVARLLMEAGTGADVAVGTPIMVTVEEEDNVAAFRDYAAPPPPPPVAAEAASPPAPAAPAPPAPAPAVVAAASSAPAPAPPAQAKAPASPPPPAAPVPLAAPSRGAAAAPWGSMAAAASPLAKALAKSQRKYVELYGSTGQAPIL